MLVWAELAYLFLVPQSPFSNPAHLPSIVKAEVAARRFDLKLFAPPVECSNILDLMY